MLDASTNCTVGSCSVDRLDRKSLIEGPSPSLFPLRNGLSFDSEPGMRQRSLVIRHGADDAGCAPLCSRCCRYYAFTTRLSSRTYPYRSKYIHSHSTLSTVTPTGTW